MTHQSPPVPTHVPGTPKGEERVRKAGREPGRQESGAPGLPDGPGRHQRQRQWQGTDRPEDAGDPAGVRLSRNPCSGCHAIELEIPRAADQPRGRTNAFATLRRFVRPRAVRERCELCSRELGPEHPHLFDPAARSCSAPASRVRSSSAAGRPVPPGAAAHSVLAGLSHDGRAVGEPAHPDQPGLFLPQHAGRPGRRPLPESRRGHRVAAAAGGLARTGAGQPGPAGAGAGRRGAAGEPRRARSGSITACPSTSATSWSACSALTGAACRAARRFGGRSGGSSRA